MKVKELIEKLSELPENSLVIISGYEAGYEEIEEVLSVKLKLNVNTKWYYGRHEIVDEKETGEPAVLIK